MTPPEFKAIWADMLRAWTSAKPAAGTASLYAKHLAGFDTGEVRAAVDELIATREFFPAPAVVIAACLAIRDPAPGWEQAWREVAAVKGKWLPGSPNTDEPAYSHPAVREAAVAIGGWDIKASTNVETTRAQFRDAYHASIARHRAEQATGRLELPAPGGRRRELEAPTAKPDPPAAEATAPRSGGRGPFPLAALLDSLRGHRSAGRARPDQDVPEPRRYTRDELIAELAKRGIPVQTEETTT